MVYGYGICDYWGADYPSCAVPEPTTHVAPVHVCAVRRAISRPRTNTPRAAGVDGRPHPDGMDVIRQHLHAKGLTSVDIDRILRVEDQLLSVDFLVKDRNLLIKYWNPQGIEH